MNRRVILLLLLASVSASCARAGFNGSPEEHEPYTFPLSSDAGVAIKATRRPAVDQGVGTADLQGVGTADLQGVGAADLQGVGTADLQGVGTADLRGLEGPSARDAQGSDASPMPCVDLGAPPDATPDAGPSCSCMGADLSGDGRVEFADLTLVAACWGCSIDAGCDDADIDGSGIVDSSDLACVKAWFFQICTP